MICWKEICSHTFKIQVCIILTVSLTRLQMLCKYFHNLDVKGKALLADETLLQNIVENIHSIHNELCSTCMDINNIFGVQTLMFFVKALTAGVGTMYAALLLKNELNLIAGLKLLTLFHWIVWRMFCLTMMAYLYHSILQQVSGIKKIIHKILRKARGQPLRATLRIFALHEMNRNLQFTVCGLFSIDLTMIQMAIASIATYVLLLIQLRAS
ncbi:unnamed protein product [Phaedon cochleariae]|uniref:Gustatory receptor n=1 Tax=Phaedon cochleariae TaxID=80249 RepID=A0A9P0DGQ8_PHACE|nr:unnamed protein product [Phaedon cochleariae]